MRFTFRKKFPIPKVPDGIQAVVFNFGVDRGGIGSIFVEGWFPDVTIVPPGGSFELQGRPREGPCEEPDASVPNKWELPENAFALLTEQANEAPEDAFVIVEFLWDPLALYRILLIDIGKLIAYFTPIQPCLDAEDLWIPAKLPASPLITPLDYYNELEALLAPVPGVASSKIQRYRWFFFDMDRRTQAGLAEIYYLGNGQAQIQEISYTGMAVQKRFAHRFAEYASDHTACTKTPGVGVFGGDVLGTSNLLIDLLQEHFQNSSGLIDYAEVEEAFEMFANGELRYLLPKTLVWSCQPSSGFYFFFAEIALLSLEMGYGVPVWSKLVNVFVRTQRIFANVYPATAGKPSLSSYTGCGYSSGATWTPSLKAVLAADFAYLTEKELCIAAAKQAHEFLPGYA